MSIFLLLFMLAILGFFGKEMEEFANEIAMVGGILVSVLLVLGVLFYIGAALISLF